MNKTQIKYAAHFVFKMSCNYDCLRFALNDICNRISNIKKWYKLKPEERSKRVRGLESKIIKELRLSYNYKG